MNRRVGGIIFVKVDGEQLQAKGEFTYNLGVPKREVVVGSDEVHGFSEKPQAPMLEGAITDSDELDVKTILSLRDSLATLDLANGKTFVLREAFYAGDGNIKTDEGEIEFKLNGTEAEEISA